MLEAEEKSRNQIEMATVLQFLLHLFLLLQQQRIAVMAQSNVLRPYCQEFCGSYSIPYPFGISPGCYRDESFEITCKKMDDGTMLPFSGGINSSLPVFNFSASQSQATMFKYLSYDCYNALGVTDYQGSHLNLRGSPFTVSAKRNKFTAIGCNTMAYIGGSNGSFASGWMSFCSIQNLKTITSGSCNGTGCCQTSLPEDLLDYDSGIYTRSSNNSAIYRRSSNDTTWKFNPCSYSFVADQNWFKFRGKISS